jgi:hypothetical protein
MLDKAQQLAEARNHKLLPFVRRGPSSASRCVTCARQVYICLNPGLNGAAIGGDAIAEACIPKPSVSAYAITVRAKLRSLVERLPQRQSSSSYPGNLRALSTPFCMVICPFDRDNRSLS